MIQDEIPELMLLLRDLASQHSVRKLVNHILRRQTAADMRIHILREVRNERRHIDIAAQLRIFLNLLIRLVVTAAAVANKRRHREKHRRRIAPLHEIPQLQQASHPPVSIEIRMQVRQIEMDNRRLCQVVNVAFCIDEIHEILHILR